MMTQWMPSRTAALPLDQEDDAILLERMKEDDTEAFRVLVVRHIDRAYALALRMLGNVADAEDVAQEALVKAWTHRANWEAGKARFSTWLYKVVFNRCIDLRRAPVHHDIDEIPEPSAEEPDAVSIIHRRQVFDRLDDAMATLPEQQRAALTLAYFGEMADAEIAEVLGTTVQAVESLLKRGRQGLKQRLRRSEREVRHLFADT